VCWGAAAPAEVAAAPGPPACEGGAVGLEVAEGTGDLAGPATVDVEHAHLPACRAHADHDLLGGVGVEVAGRHEGASLERGRERGEGGYLLAGVAVEQLDCRP